MGRLAAAAFSGSFAVLKAAPTKNTAPAVMTHWNTLFMRMVMTGNSSANSFPMQANFTTTRIVCVWPTLASAWSGGDGFRGGLNLRGGVTVEPENAAENQGDYSQHDDEEHMIFRASRSKEEKEAGKEGRQIPQGHQAKQPRLGEKGRVPECGIRGGMRPEQSVAQGKRPDDTGDKTGGNEEHEAAIIHRTTDGGLPQMMGEYDDDNKSGDALLNRSLSRIIDEVLNQFSFVHRVDFVPPEPSSMSLPARRTDGNRRATSVLFGINAHLNRRLGSAEAFAKKPRPIEAANASLPGTEHRAGIDDPPRARLQLLGGGDPVDPIPACHRRDV